MGHWRAITEISGGWEISEEGNLKRAAHDIVFYVQGRPKKKFIPEIRYTPSDYINGNLTLDVNGKPMFYNIGELVAKYCVSNPNRYKFFQYRDGNPSNVMAENIVWTKTPDEKIEQVIQVEQEDKKIQEKGENNMGVMNWFGFGKKSEKTSSIGKDVSLAEWNNSLETSANEVLAEISEEAVKKVKTEKKTKRTRKSTKASKTVAKKTSKKVSETITETTVSTEETWYPIEGYEGFEVSSEKRIRRQTKKGWSYLKSVIGKSGKTHASTTINNKYKTFIVDDILAKVINTTVTPVKHSETEVLCRPAQVYLPSSEVTFEVIPVKSTVSEEIQSIIDNFDTYTSESLKDRLNILLSMSRESENKFSDMISSIRETLDKYNSVETVETTDEIKTETDEKELWRTTYLSTRYQVSNLGRLRRKCSETEAKKKGSKYVISEGIVRGGYRKFSLQIDGKQVIVRADKLMLNSFNRTSLNKKVVYLNGNKSYLRLSNIAWAK